MGEKAGSASEKEFIAEKARIIAQNARKLDHTSKLTLKRMVANLDAVYHRLRATTDVWPGKLQQEARLAKQVGDLHRLTKKPSLTNAEMENVRVSTRALLKSVDIMMNDPGIKDALKNGVLSDFNDKLKSMNDFIYKDKFSILQIS